MKNSDILNQKGLFQRLIMIATRLEANANRYYFEPMGLTTTYCKIICMLASKEGMTPTEILRMTGGTKSNISQRLDVLEKQGYAKRSTPDTGDKRNVRIELTEKGRNKFEEVKEFVNKKSDFLEQQFTTEEKIHLHNIIDKLNKIMDGHDERLAKEKHRI